MLRRALVVQVEQRIEVSRAAGIKSVYDDGQGIERAR
jgi:hypothetical protein